MEMTIELLGESLEKKKVLYLPSKVTALQDAHGRLVLQVYLGSNTLEFSAIYIGEIFVSRLWETKFTAT